MATFNSIFSLIEKIASMQWISVAATGGRNQYETSTVVKSPVSLLTFAPSRLFFQICALTHET